ncbi:helicase [Fopius arisanus]|nr:helicase [Fopius arisanus]
MSRVSNPQDVQPSTINLKKDMSEEHLPDKREVEMNFLQQYNVQPFKYSEGEMLVVLHSHTLDQHYNWPITQTLDSDMLKCFSKTGHTLALDYRQMYFRKFALDLECICQKNQQCMGHLNTYLADKIQRCVLEKLKIHFPMSEPKGSLWRNHCGFRLYTSIVVSLPTHLHIAHQISNYFLHEGVTIEVPSMMPLPYSSKQLVQLYLPLVPNQPKVSLTPQTDDSFWEMFEFKHIPTEHQPLFAIKTRDRLISMTAGVTAREVYALPQFYNVEKTVTSESYEYFNQFGDYVMQLVVHRQAITAAHIEINEMTNLSLISNKYRTQLMAFMSEFNMRYNRIQSVHVTTFVKISSQENDGLYLQPCVVMMHKYLLQDEQPIGMNEFITMLRHIYHNAIRQDKKIARFIEFYDINTLECYDDSWDRMMNHICWVHSKHLRPYDSFEQQIDYLLSQFTHKSSYRDFCAYIRRVSTDERATTISSLMDECVDIIIELQLIMYSSSTGNHYVLEDGTFYKVIRKMESLPAVFSRWFDNNPKCIDILIFMLSSRRDEYTIPQESLFSECKFQFATSVGVFNSLTGLYTAKTKFLRFQLHRKYAIWPLNMPLQMYGGQNSDIFERLEMGMKYARIIHENLTPLFVHFILAPAMIHLRYVMCIEESQINKLIFRLIPHRDLSSAYFLVEYFPVDPRFIFFIMHVFVNCDGFGSFVSYSTLANHLFSYSTPDDTTWRGKIIRILEGMTVTEGPTQMDTLLSISGQGVHNPSRELCFYSTLLAVCILKCSTFNACVRAFNLPSDLPRPLAIHPEYEDITFKMGSDVFQRNLQRAIRILYGTSLPKEEANLVVGMFYLGMSTYFDPAATTEFLATLSAVFVPHNVLKKAFLYYGPGGVGKSLICNIIQEMVGPRVGRFSNLSQAIERANITAKNNVTILNELQEVETDKIKSITGNDAESTKQFYTQEYEMHKSQSLIYGATNGILQFIPKENDVDIVSVRRFHAIKLTGQQINTDGRANSLFSMMANAQVFNNTISIKVPKLANAVALLAYSSYVLRRDKNMFPRINEEHQDSKQYRDEVYRKNNRLYAFMASIGIVIEPDFSIEWEVMRTLVKFGLSDKSTQYHHKISSVSAFQSKFETQYGIKLNNTAVVPNFQEYDFLEHVYANMAIVLSTDDAILTRQDIEVRSLFYKRVNDRDNASSYFQRENKQYYDHVSGVYRGIKWQNPGFWYNSKYDDIVSMACQRSTNDTPPRGTSA